MKLVFPSISVSVVCSTAGEVKFSFRLSSSWRGRSVEVTWPNVSLLNPH